MIPAEEYHSCPSFSYITEELFKKHHSEGEWKVFCYWMRGQTCSEANGECAIYSWDYERWLRQGRKQDQGLDWD